LYAIQVAYLLPAEGKFNSVQLLQHLSAAMAAANCQLPSHHPDSKISPALRTKVALAAYQLEPGKMPAC
jgi:hypothetical protein